VESVHVVPMAAIEIGSLDSVLSKDHLPGVTVPIRILHKTPQNPRPCLQQRMTDDDLQKPLEPLPSLLDDRVVKLVEVHFAWQWRDRDASALALEDIAEVLEVAVAAAHGAVAELEGGDVGREGYEVGRVA